MNVKLAFLDENFEEHVYIDQPEGFSVKEINTWYVNYRNQHTDLKKLLDNGTISLMIP